jgi:molybdopterin converting factor small subunit
LNIFLKASVAIEETEVAPINHDPNNGKNMRDMEALATILSDGDEVAIFPPVSGG